MTGLGMIAAAMLLAACSDPEPAAQTAAAKPPEDALAMVNGKAVTEADVEYEVNRMLGQTAPLVADDSVQRRVLESLVAGRAIADRRLQELDKRSLRRIDQQVEAYRVQLLVEDYLREHAVIAPVTANEVRAYYQAHPKSFGQEQVKVYEYLRLHSGLSDADRASALQRLAVAGAQADWSDYAQGHTQWLEHGRGRSDGPQLEPALASALRKLGADAVSGVVMVDGRAHRLRVTAVQELPATPLEEVRDEIRRILAAQRMRESVKVLSSEVLMQARVIYREAVQP
nr:peptidyl-prolyl cis-trans isomerase [Oceanococcus sp. HetDA_MAG_MS8]